MYDMGSIAINRRRGYYAVFAQGQEQIVGRKKQFESRITLPLSEEMMERIAAVLDGGEVRLDFIREAIDRELKRRERKARK